jgi:hypothetical protein
MIIFSAEKNAVRSSSVMVSSQMSSGRSVAQSQPNRAEAMMTGANQREFMT